MDARQVLVATAMVGLLAGCSGGSSSAPVAAEPHHHATAKQPATPRSTPTHRPLQRRPAPGTVRPAWLGTRVLPRTASGYGAVRATPPELRDRRFTLPDRLPMLPGRGFTARISDPAPARVVARSTWLPSCPVAARRLAWVRLAFWGFDRRRHTGELLLNDQVARPVVSVFRRLYAARFPIEQMTIATRADLTAPPTGDGNGTGSFVCRPVTGGTSYSQHAYGLAVDVNTFQNPYHAGDLVLPELASSYLDRRHVRPGMITPQGPVVRAFDAIGWGWGGRWHRLQDYQHFSANGR